MPLNKSTGNMYEFVTHTWNTTKGECPNSCKYCYMHRRGKQLELHFDEKELKTNLGKSNFIFVGSSCDLFAEDMPEEWILSTLEKCAHNQDNKYFFQSKNPERMIRMVKNAQFDCCICTTIETNRIYEDIMGNAPSPKDRALSFEKYSGKLEKYVTIEPIMDFDLEELVALIKQCNPKQVNIGADSGNNHLPEPSKEKVLSLVDELNKFTVVANKHNLGRILNAN